ncbi:hypothetical protein EDF56_1187 [Novosphingobium sp. PhB165]|nr:hypothetical protein EDF56_1187 [Novosphingobium sp. PhB165]
MRDNAPVSTITASAATADFAWTLLTLALFAGWTFWIGSSHEAWFDEAQAWLLARDSTPYQLLVERVRYEGSPGLWHLILWTAIRCGLPYSLLFLISGSFAVAGAALILTKAPFPRWLRTGAICSYFFAYQFAAVARSYAADLLLVPLAACFFPGRFEKPWRYAFVLGLIANLNAHGFVAAGALGVEWAWQASWRSWRRKRLPTWHVAGALAVTAFMGLCALATAWQPADNYYIRAEHSNILGTFTEILRAAFIDRILVFSTARPGGLDAAAGLALSIAAFLSLLQLILRGRYVAAGFTPLAAVLIFSVTTYASLWHGGLLFLFMLFGVWINWPEGKGSVHRDASIALATVFVIQAAQAGATGLWDRTHVFSPGREAAQIMAEVREASPQVRIAAYGYLAFSAQPWLPSNPFANYHNGSVTPAYIVWRRDETWDPFGSETMWRELLRQNPDMIVASAPALTADRAAMIEIACQNGYAVDKALAGELHWRGWRFASDDLLILQHRPCV